jgi:hypothetical protein
LRIQETGETEKRVENREKANIVLSARIRNRLKAYAKSLVEFFCKGNVHSTANGGGSTESYETFKG